MSSFFPTIEGLESIPDFNFRYARAILERLIAKIIKLDEIDVGLYCKERFGSVISFADDEFERVIIHLEYEAGKYKLSVLDNSEGFETSRFEYNISEQESLIEMIPDGLREFMEKVEEEQQEAILRPGTLNL